MEKSATLPQHSPHPYPQIIAKFTYPHASFLIIFFILKGYIRMKKQYCYDLAI